GTSLKLFLTPTGGAETLLAYVYDSTFTAAGLTGMLASKGATLANFSADQIVVTAPTSLPFTDDFSNPVNGTQLGGASPNVGGTRNWDERLGNFTDNGTSALGTAADKVVIVNFKSVTLPTNLATVHGVSTPTADPSVLGNA